MYIDKRKYSHRKAYKNKESLFHTETLADRYIVKLIKRHSNLSSNDIRQNTELIILYRNRLLLKREIKKYKNN